MKEDLYVVRLSLMCEPWGRSEYIKVQRYVLSTPGTRCFDDPCSVTFTMLFNVALFSSLLLVPAILAVPSALAASVAQSQLNSRQAVQPISAFPNGWAGAIVTNDNVCSAGYSAWISSTSCFI